MLIDCSSCTMRDLACGDCVVTALLEAPPTLSLRERGALAVLADSGLVAPLRLVPGDGAPTGPTRTGRRSAAG